jgi:O-antigen biosynthesis protein
MNSSNTIIRPTIIIEPAEPDVEFAPVLKASPNDAMRDIPLVSDMQGQPRRTARERSTTPEIATVRPDVQSGPALLDPADKGSQQMFKVDRAFCIGTQIVVVGWSSVKTNFGLKSGNVDLKLYRSQVARPDVASHFKLADDLLGFVLVADSFSTEPISMTWSLAGQQQATSQPLKLDPESRLRVTDAALGPALAHVALSLPPHSPQWRALVAKVPSSTAHSPNAKGYLEAASTCEKTGDGVVVGWAAQSRNSHVWLEDEVGNTHSLEGAYRRFRQDVHDVIGGALDHANRDAGMVVRMSGLKTGGMVRLKTISETGIHTLSEVYCQILPSDPVAASQWLFSIAAPMSEIHGRIPLIDAPVLEALIQRRAAMWHELPVAVTQLGTPPAAPKVSIIVPLYGRTDFVEHQLLEFCADPWFMKHAELIYVIDDPKLPEPFIGQAEALHRLYKVPFCWLWGNANRGYSGANNLGVQHANGQYLVFLNSDAFPQQPGWLEALVDVLETRPDIGAVGPRLTFADGSIQHAGMEFMRRNELGIWVNHHPNMGLDPSFDPTKELTLVPAVTGACLAMRRTDFDLIDGWDTGYLIGDFEDSDLCLKLRTEGFNIGYLPTVQLTHLERQSFKLLGHGEFRTRVVIYNAVRHQTRWASVIDQPVKAPAPTTAHTKAFKS